MSENGLEAVERDLDRATDLDDEAARETLEGARERLERLEDADVDEERRTDLVHRVDQRLREVAERDAYDADAEPGAAMNPEEDEAP